MADAPSSLPAVLAIDGGTSKTDLALNAARLGGRNRVAAALLAHPLVGQYSLAEAMTDRLLAENAQFLPWA